MRHLGTTTFVIMLSAAAIFAQDSGKAFRQAPLGLEDALKTRVMEFFNLLQEGKFRQSEAYVCEDSKDFYYGKEKSRHRSASYIRATFEADYKSARVQVDIDSDIHTPRGPFPAKFPVLSHWRAEGGQWCYFVPKENQEYLVTPFGKIKRGDGTGPAAPPPGFPVDMESFRSAVKISQTDVELPASSESSRDVTLVNTLPGPVEIQYEPPPIAGLTIEIDKKVLKEKESATIRVRYVPKPNTVLPPVTVRFVVSPSGQQIPLRLLFSRPSGA